LFYVSLGGKTRLRQLTDGTEKPVPIPRGRGEIVRVGEVSGGMDDRLRCRRFSDTRMAA
jgi:hypothetical protein